jgi:hypothetical protein
MGVVEIETQKNDLDIVREVLKVTKKSSDRVHLRFQLCKKAARPFDPPLAA